MLPTVLLLLSILTVQGSGCDEFMKTTVRNLQRTVDGEKTKGFQEVFPKNYLVSHYFNDSAVCNEPCCVLSGAVFLSNSWSKLLQHLNRVHRKYRLISELIYTLDKLTEKKFQETPDIANFPSIQSTPEDLLSFTSSLFSKWLRLDCAFGEHRCIFPIPSEEDEDDLESKEEENREISDQMDEPQPVIEGPISKRQLDYVPTSGYTELCFPGFFRWTLYFLWIATHAFLISLF